MGKPTGFLEQQRDSVPKRAPLERINDFEEFHGSLSEEERRRQGGRCMNCGVPFCQSAIEIKGTVTGCPLYNLIPEWNDEVYGGHDHQALLRLQKTNNFPEFTGRVCPALCEAACVCGVGDQPVTIKDNELAIIELAFSKGMMSPRIPKVRTDKKIAVVGSGPAGLACADMLNQRGHQVTVYEKSDRIGGLLMYGIPNMKLDKKIVDRRAQLMAAEGVRFLTGVEVGGDLTSQELADQYDGVVLCCGAQQPRDIVAEGREGAKGVYFAVEFLTANTKSLLDSGFEDHAYMDPKDCHVVVVGGGDTGNDCVGTAIRHKCKSVTQIEWMPKPPENRGEDNPWPEFPKNLKYDYGQEEAIAVFGQDPRQYARAVKRVITDERQQVTAVETVAMGLDEKGQYGPVAGSEETLPCDLLLIAAGFTGCSPKVAETFGVKLTGRNTVETQQEGFFTGIPRLFAAGDVRRGQSLVVFAIAEGRKCAREVDRFLGGYSDSSLTISYPHRYL